MKRFITGAVLAIALLFATSNAHAGNHGVSFSVGHGHGHNVGVGYTPFATYSYAFPVGVRTFGYAVQPYQLSGAYSGYAGCPSQLPAAAPADPCTASYGTYGATTVALPTGYTSYTALLQGYGRTTVYRDNVGVFRVFNVRTNQFVAVPGHRVGRVTAIRVGGGNGVNVQVGRGGGGNGVNVQVGRGGGSNVEIRQRTGLLGRQQTNIRIGK